MSVVGFHELFPDVARLETREAIIPPPAPGGSTGIPAGHYGFVENYCVDPACDCRRVIITVLRGREKPSVVATINHAFEPPPKGHPMEEEGQTFLDPINPQSAWSEELLDLFVHVILPSEGYADRLVRHYRMVKQAVKDPSHPIHESLPSEKPWRSQAPARPGLPPGRRAFRKKWRR